MVEETEFTFERSRGIVWVCDLESSSKYLNDNESATELETFLPRLHWTALAAVSAAGGRFLKWTGDGFLAWFETPLHREIGARAAALFEALWQLTFTVNVTQLGVATSRKFRLRHGVAYEHDALLTRIKTAGDTALDITGRAVVLAFRLSGVQTSFPGVTTQGELGTAAAEVGYTSIPFKSWRPSRDELLRYFKGEKWGTTRLVRSGDRRPRVRTLKSVVRTSKKLIEKVEQPAAPPAPGSFAMRYVTALDRGPAWAQKVLRAEKDFVMNELLGNLKSVTVALSKDPGQPVN